MIHATRPSNVVTQRDEPHISERRVGPRQLEDCMPTSVGADRVSGAVGNQYRAIFGGTDTSVRQAPSENGAGAKQIANSYRPQNLSPRLATPLATIKTASEPDKVLRKIAGDLRMIGSANVEESIVVVYSSVNVVDFLVN